MGSCLTAVLPISKFLWNKSDYGIKSILVVTKNVKYLKKKKSKTISIFVFTLCHFCLVRELQWLKRLLVSLASLNLTFSANLVIAFSYYLIFKAVFLKTPSRKLIQCEFQCFFTKIRYSNTYVGVPQSFPDQICQSVLKKTQTLNYPHPLNPTFFQSWILEGRFYATPKPG